MRRIKIIVSYDGTAYSGWQKQPGFRTIQTTLEDIVAGIDKKPVAVHASGRTDAGVHAYAQVAAFNLENPIPEANLRKAINRLLPHDIRIVSVEEVHRDFHPRFDSVAKTYQYTIFRAEVCPPFVRRYVHHYPYPADEAAMIAIAALYEGEHDFSAFAAADAERDKRPNSKVRRIFSSAMWKEEDRLVYRVRGSGFLKHMVRNMVGTLLEAGKGNLDGGGLRELLTGHGKCGSTAPASGLFLVKVEYPESYVPSTDITDVDRDHYDARQRAADPGSGDER
jgi:tRNA pseudouridine38-40 synthase